MNFKGVSKSTWVRMVALLVILVNLVSVSLFNHQLVPFSDEQVYEGVSTLLTVLVGFWTAWKNNSFSKDAQLADLRLKQLKGGK
jgi:SPP1 family holin